MKKRKSEMINPCFKTWSHIDLQANFWNGRSERDKFPSYASAIDGVTKSLQKWAYFCRVQSVCREKKCIQLFWTYEKSFSLPIGLCVSLKQLKSISGNEVINTFSTVPISKILQKKANVKVIKKVSKKEKITYWIWIVPIFLLVCYPIPKTECSIKCVGCRMTPM